MSANEEEILPPAEDRFRVVLAWLSLWLMLSGGGVLFLYLLGFAILLAMGGVELVSNVLAEQENRSNDYSSAIYASIFIGIPIGALFGVWLWSKLMRKTGFISGERVKRMSGF